MSAAYRDGLKGIYSGGFLKKVWWATATLLFVFVFIPSQAVSQTFEPFRESKLFDEAYEYYLEYKPDKAVETFKLFLKEFPGSSAGDAAMFWLGKSLAQINAYDEAERVFSDLRKQFPESPFLPQLGEQPRTKLPGDRARGGESRIQTHQAKSEIQSGEDAGAKERAKSAEERQKLREQLQMERTQAAELKEKVTKLEGQDAEVKGLRDALKEKQALESKLAETEKKAELKEKDRASALAESERLKKSLEDERRKAEELTSRVVHLQDKEKKLESLLSEIEEQKRKMKETDKKVAEMQAERDRLHSEVEGLKGRLGEASKGKAATKEKEAETKVLLAKLDEQQSNLKEMEKNLTLLKQEKERLEVERGKQRAERDQIEKEREKLKTSLEEEKRRTAEAQEKLAYQGKRDAEVKGLRDALKEKQALESKLAETEKKAELKEKDRASALAESERLKKSLEDERRKAEELTSRVVHLQDKEKKLESLLSEIEEQKRKMKETDKKVAEMQAERDRLHSEVEGLKGRLGEASKGKAATKEKEAETKVLLAKLDEQQSNLKEMEKNLTRIEGEKKNLDLQIQRMNQEKAAADREKDDIRTKISRSDDVVLKIRGRSFTRQEISDATMTSFVVRDKMGVREVPWGTGNVYEDFVNEHLLLDEARRLSVVPDARLQRELAEKHHLNNRERGSLENYLTIRKLFERKLQSRDFGTGERMVELLRVRYAKKDELEKAVFAAGLHAQTRNGKSFGEISRRYPDTVRSDMVPIRRLQGLLRENAKALGDEELSNVLSLKDEYVILRPVKGNVQYRLDENSSPEMAERKRVFIREWVNELREAAARESGVERIE